MSGKILIVEDNNEFRQAITNFLEGQDSSLKVFGADSGDSGIELAKKMQPDIVIMDVRLPRMNGIITAQVIKEHVPQADVIILTMFDTTDYKKLSYKANFRAFISKSELYDRLMPVIRKCLKERSLHHAKK